MVMAKNAYAYSDAIEERPNIPNLLQQYAAEIQEVKILLQENELYQANLTFYDDIWILRFLLSHNRNTISSANAALKTIQFREENKLNEIGDIRSKIPTLDHDLAKDMFPSVLKLNKHMKPWGYIHFLPDENRSLISYFALNNINMKALSDDLGYDGIKEVYIILNESSYQILDSISRSTGKLTKLLKVVDFENVRLRDFSMSYLKNDAKVTKALEDYYPQMLGMLVVVNSPSWFRKVWNILKPFFPKRFVEKVKVLQSLENMNEKDLKALFSYVSYENYPKRLGGLNESWPLPYAGMSFKERKKNEKCIAEMN